MEQRNENKTELKMIKMSDVQSQTVDWLWYPFIPYGKLTIIQGDPGDGKTTIAGKDTNLCAIWRREQYDKYSWNDTAGNPDAAAGCRSSDVPLSGKMCPKSTG